MPFDQFADAPDDIDADQAVHSIVPKSNTRWPPHPLSGSTANDEHDEDEFFEETEEESDDMIVNHADWEDASGGEIFRRHYVFHLKVALIDLTKRYNRLRQRVSAHSSSTSGLKDHTTTSGFSPPVNLPNQTTSSSTQESAIRRSKISDQLLTLSSRFSQSIDFGISGSQGGTGSSRKGGSEKIQIVKDKSDRATSEQVLDDRTRLILYKMMGRSLIARIDGCVSTGKEANVYHAISGPYIPPANSSNNTFTSPLPRHLALKIYKTSILHFKDRSSYITGESN
jgi:RIO kinase 1